MIIKIEYFNWFSYVLNTIFILLFVNLIRETIEIVKELNSELEYDNQLFQNNT